MLEYEDIVTERDLLEAFEVLDEAYFGKSKELMEIEKLLDQYRKKYIGRYTLIGAAANTDKLLVKINRLFEKQFGFGDFAILVIDTADMNAFTFSIDNRYDTNVNKNKLANDKTFKFNKDCDYAVITCIFAGLIFNKDFTTEEILAILLHEIGHNFYAALTTTNTVFSACQKAVNFAGIVNDLYKIFKSDEEELQKAVNAAANLTVHIIGAPTYLNFVMKPMVKAIKHASEHKTENTITAFHCLSCFYLGIMIYKLYKKIMFWINTIFAPIRTLAAIIESVMKKFWRQVSDPIHILNMPNGFRNERTADNFATMYGYGPSLASGLDKLYMGGHSADGIDDLPAIVPFVSCLFDALMLPMRLISNAIDPHPLEIQRATDQIRMLEEEMNKSNLDPKMKKRIQKDIDKMKKSVADSMDTSRSITTDPDFVKHLVNRIMYNTVEAKSFRDVIFNFDPNGKYKSYDKTIDEVYEKNKK